jgi:hypothetical protein
MEYRSLKAPISPTFSSYYIFQNHHYFHFFTLINLVVVKMPPQRSARMNTCRRRGLLPGHDLPSYPSPAMEQYRLQFNDMLRSKHPGRPASTPSNQLSIIEAMNGGVIATRAIRPGPLPKVRILVCKSSIY